MTSDKVEFRITIPENLSFSDLKLVRDKTGDVSFDWRPIESICEASGIDVSVFRDQHEDNVAGLIMKWYEEHLKRGGARDAVQDDLIAETIAEDAHGGGLSHQPGRA